MPDIGFYGPLVFEVSGIRARSFSEMSQKSSGRWAEHVPINSIPVSEFLGPGLDELSLKIIFTVMLGINPKEEYEQLRELIRKGEHHPLILQGIPVSQNEWRCNEISAESTVFAPGDGKAMWMECELQFKEYA